MNKHQNSGFCGYFQDVFNRYPGFNEALMGWFFSLQKQHPEAHLSCAGRGEQDQEALFLKGASKAHYGESAHNYNCAIDLFVNKPDTNIYDRAWFRDVMKPALPSWATWYGWPGSKFWELPHIEISDWHDMVDNGELKLVE